MKIRGNTVLITGGGSGIGLSLAEKLTGHGNTVIACGRSQDRLDAARQKLPELHTFACDVASEASREELAGWVRAHHPELNVLVNNAAIMRRIDLAGGGGGENLELEVAVNFLAPMALVARFLPLLEKQPSAAILNVSSGLAYVPMAGMPVYSATKAALHSYSQSLRHQLRDTPVKVFELLPPGVETEMVRDLEMNKISSAEVADVTLRAMARDQAEIRPGQAKTLYLMSRAAPGFIYNRLNP